MHRLDQICLFCNLAFANRNEIKSTVYRYPDKLILGFYSADGDAKSSVATIHDEFIYHQYYHVSKKQISLSQPESAIAKQVIKYIYDGYAEIYNKRVFGRFGSEKEMKKIRRNILNSYDDGIDAVNYLEYLEKIK